MECPSCHLCHTISGTFTCPTHNQCGRNTTEGEKYCQSHDSDVKRAHAAAQFDKPSKCLAQIRSVVGRFKRCSRNEVKGTGYCFQHQEKNRRPYGDYIK